MVWDPGGECPTVKSHGRQLQERAFLIKSASFLIAQQTGLILGDLLAWKKNHMTAGYNTSNCQILNMIVTRVALSHFANVQGT